MYDEIRIAYAKNGYVLYADNCEEDAFGPVGIRERTILVFKTSDELARWINDNLDTLAQAEAA